MLQALKTIFLALFFGVALGEVGEFCSLNKDCDTKSEFCNKAASAKNGTCVFQDCDTLFQNLKTRLNEPYGEISCGKYDGDLVGQLAQCGGVSYSTDPESPYTVIMDTGGEDSKAVGNTNKVMSSGEIITRTWERRCTASTLFKDQFTCYDNKDADFTEFKSITEGENLNDLQECKSGDKDFGYQSPVIHKGFDYLFGTGADIFVDFKGGSSTDLDTEIATSAVYAIIVPGDSRPTEAGSGAETKLFVAFNSLMAAALAFLMLA